MPGILYIVATPIGNLEDITFRAVDAGTPLISDPGYRVVKSARDAGIKVVPIPGAGAAITALSAGGLGTDAFYFGGFLPSKSQQRRRVLEDAGHRRRLDFWV